MEFYMQKGVMSELKLRNDPHNLIVQHPNGVSKKSSRKK